VPFRVSIRKRPDVVAHLAIAFMLESSKAPLLRTALGTVRVLIRDQPPAQAASKSRHPALLHGSCLKSDCATGSAKGKVRYRVSLRFHYAPDGTTVVPCQLWVTETFPSSNKPKKLLDLGDTSFPRASVWNEDVLRIARPKLGENAWAILLQTGKLSDSAVTPLPPPLPSAQWHPIAREFSL